MSSVRYLPSARLSMSASSSLKRFPAQVPVTVLECDQSKSVRRLSEVRVGK